MNACQGTAWVGTVLGSTLECSATCVACARWVGVAQQKHVLIKHDNASGTLSADAYAKAVIPGAVVATIAHTSLVKRKGVDLAAFATLIRKFAPDCLIFAKGYVISPYSIFSHHGYSPAWLLD
ncbi:hypothetical protein [Leisingera sp. ANG-Vp]|uniref:hypothetical protein n=1 Tax=Leisingera sp. ANG-Vp TaxID=1577896 RepID=UPI00068B5460|nr:hypothetical protein [Leisingera sp. ANG-Vp]